MKKKFINKYIKYQKSSYLITNFKNIIKMDLQNILNIFDMTMYFKSLNLASVIY